MVGRRTEANAIFDYDRLVQVRRFAEVDGFASRADFDTALTRHILAHPTLMTDRPGKSTMGGDQTLELLHEDNAVAGALGRLIHGAVGAYITDVLRAADDPRVNRVPDDWRLTTWAVVLRSGGHQSPHIHPEGFCSGVYYARVPEIVAAGGETNPGCLKFGQTRPDRRGDGSQEGFLTRIVKPRPGTMVLFPSHFWHHTIPFDGPEERICVAFDVRPV